MELGRFSAYVLLINAGFNFFPSVRLQQKSHRFKVQIFQGSVPVLVFVRLSDICISNVLFHLHL